jgi:sphingosine kinase
MLAHAHLDITLVHTERAGHAREMMADLNPGQYDTLVACSGDGILHEIINGLLTRPDWPEFCKTIALSMIPGGTSNGYCTSVLKSLDERYGVLEMAYRLIAGKRSAMDVVELNGEYETEKIFMFLMFSWGLVADIAQNSEGMRCLGTGRYTVRALYRLCWTPRY